MRFRIGINVGDVMVKDGDIFGDGVNVAARLEALADGGGICVSRGVRDHLRHRRGLVFDDLGEQLVKNIAHPVRAYRLRVGHNPETFISEVPLPAETEVSADSEVALELSLWESVKDGSQVELASYLEHYPDGTFASLARLRQNTPEHEIPGVETTRSANPNVTIDALDLAFWDAIKESQTPEELTAYLESHPEGHFAALVRTRLSQPTEEHQDEIRAVEAGSAGDAVELAFWESVSDTDDPRLLSAYLEKYQQGEFAPIALIRLKALREAEGKGN